MPWILIILYVFVFKAFYCHKIHFIKRKTTFRSSKYFYLHLALGTWIHLRIWIILIKKHTINGWAGKINNTCFHLCVAYSIDLFLSSFPCLVIRKDWQQLAACVSNNNKKPVLLLNAKYESVYFIIMGLKPLSFIPTSVFIILQMCICILNVLSGREVWMWG